MAPASNEEQFKFLISCIRYSNNGKVDFGEVAKECGIVSKGAAAKRYERMMKAHGIAPNTATGKPAVSRPVKSERGESSTTAPSKKRKLETYSEDNAADDEEEGSFSNIKPDPTDQKEHLQIIEQPVQLSTSEATDLMQYYPDPSTAYEDDEFTSVLASGPEGDFKNYASSPMNDTQVHGYSAFNYPDTPYSPLAMTNGIHVSSSSADIDGYQSPYGGTEYHDRADTPVILE